ncbi:EAL domain-containing protein [Thalassotalea sp. M1531]|uniref:EAL domain-containing protein n=1 Tax=Thalassotalea algicola TaxID=2716224 RepID=A0A7Y0Q615_9GAMM|nr:EAL domain-containing protein [Thalassotalea algicola]NMP30696.1 EAL domain-containing protein [Thalassotalea algicola]
MKEIIASRRTILLTSLIFLALVLWNAYSSVQLHKSYQHALMKSVTDSVLADYQEYLAQLRTDVIHFQGQNYTQIAALANKGPLASKEEYMQLLKLMKNQFSDLRLFAIIDNNAQGVLKHITGDFLDDCKDEIRTTVDVGSQEHLFLHRSSNSIHYDLLEPLNIPGKQGWYFFVAFNTTVFESLLIKYQLPHQELFLLRTDLIGKIELSTTTTTDEHIAGIEMSAEEVQMFSFVKEIPGTRWQLAIRQEPNYQSSILVKSVIKALILWLFASAIILAFYLFQRQRARSHYAIKKALEFNATHDALTGLMNRATFEQSLTNFISQAKDNPTHGVVLLVDIDQFQLINNGYGYAVGDSVLNFLSIELKRYLPENVACSRLGNDEFAILVPDLSFEHAQACANKLKQFINDLSYVTEESLIKLTASIGVLHIDTDQISRERIFNSLAQAVRIAKEKGRNRAQLYQSDDQALIQHAQEMSVIKDIDAALNENRFMLYRQHINALQGDINIPKYEVLVRLKSRQDEIIPPDHFIPACEKFGLITKLDRWVIEATCKSIADTGDNGHYSINLSGITLADKDIKEFVSNMFEKYHINPNRIGFEITETYAITHLESATKFIGQMSEMGCEFSLDDFGSGLSSFSYLQQLPVHHIKIDGSFIKDICNNRLNQVFVETMHKLAKEMGKDCIAEFVEDKATQEHLIELGIEFAQGYYHHRPEKWFEY